MELLIFVGLQGSGKSTFYRQCFAATHDHISLDLLRGNAKPRVWQEHLIAEALAAGRSVVVDNTSPTVTVRAPLIAQGKQYGATMISYYFETPLAEAIARNRQRQGRARVPDRAIYATAKKLCSPTFAEGFDQVYRVRAREGGFDVAALEVGDGLEGTVSTSNASPDRDRQ